MAPLKRRVFASLGPPFKVWRGGSSCLPVARSRSKVSFMRRANGTIQVFTFKEGVLSAVAHDLRVSPGKLRHHAGRQRRHWRVSNLKSLQVERPDCRTACLQADQYDGRKSAPRSPRPWPRRGAAHPKRHPKGVIQRHGYSGRCRLFTWTVSSSSAATASRWPSTFKKRPAVRTGPTFELQPSRWGIAAVQGLTRRRYQTEKTP